MSTLETCAWVLELIDEAVAAGVRAAPACAVLGLSGRTLPGSGLSGARTA